MEIKSHCQASINLDCARQVLHRLLFGGIAVLPFFLGAAYAFINLSGGWGGILEGHDYSFYGVFSRWPMHPWLGCALAITWLSSIMLICRLKAFSSNTPRRIFWCGVAVFVLSVSVRWLFFAALGRGIGNCFDPLWAWQRACGEAVSYNSHIHVPAWLNFSMVMKAFISLAGPSYDGFLMSEMLFAGLAALSVLLIGMETSGSLRCALCAALLWALYPANIVYNTAGASSEHMPIGLFAFGVWLVLRSLRTLGARGLLLWAFAGFVVGAADALKPIFPLFFIALILTVLMSVTLRTSRTNGHDLRIWLGIVLFALCRLACVQGVLAVTERVYGCRLDPGDAAPHYLSVGLDRHGEGQVHLVKNGMTFFEALMNGVPRREAAAKARRVIWNDWKGHGNEVLPFLFRKTVWAWQEDNMAFNYYYLNRFGPDDAKASSSTRFRTGKLLSPGMKRCVSRFCEYGTSMALATYMVVMALASVASFRLAARTPVNRSYLLLGLIVVGYFLLVLLGEAQSRYKCLIMPYACIFVAQTLLDISGKGSPKSVEQKNRGFALWN